MDSLDSVTCFQFVVAMVWNVTFTYFYEKQLPKVFFKKKVFLKIPQISQENGHLRTASLSLSRNYFCFERRRRKVWWQLLLTLNQFNFTKILSQGVFTLIIFQSLQLKNGSLFHSVNFTLNTTKTIWGITKQIPKCNEQSYYKT